MNKRIIGLFFAAALLFAICGLASASQYALAVSSSKLYQVEVSGSNMTYRQIKDLGESSWARSISTYGDKVLVTEVTSSGSKLRAFRLSSGGITETASISLSGITYANSVASTSSGGIYVTDGSSTSSSYAYMSSLSDSAHVSTIGTGYAPLVDVATSDNNAVIISKHKDTVTDESHISKVIDGDLKNTKSLENGSYPRYPVAVTAKSDYAYVVSEVYNSTSTNCAALSVYNISGNTVDPPTQLNAGFVPTDIITYTNTADSVDYLAMIGRTTSGTLQAWKATISGGTIGTWTTKNLGTDGGLNFQCAASADGSLLWYSSPTGQYVGATSWSGSVTTDLGDGITGLVAFTGGMDPVVPEPSSLLALASFGLGAFGFYRKRKSS
ncbi:PEP-CTERM sorting domain-containing protein [bacterium]|nr:PEP-CTERM sorting domain-containing protein [bacterium]